MNENEILAMANEYYEKVITALRQYCAEHELYPWEVGIVPNISTNTEDQTQTIGICLFPYIHKDNEEENKTDNT